jgi:putative DNA primase/helicase
MSGGSDPILAMVDDAPLLADDRALLYEPANDTGNAKRLVARHGFDMIHVDRTGWMVWDGKRFAGGAIGEAEAVKRAQMTAQSITDEARQLDDEIRAVAVNAMHDAALNEKFHYLKERAKKGKHFSFGVASGNSARVRGMLDMAKPFRRLPANDLDVEPFKLNCQNGTLILGAKNDPNDAAALMPHTRKDLITKLAGAPYDPDATCPLFLKFLQRILPDESLRHFLQVWFGYCLSGSIREQNFVICYGTGANGKSVLLSVIKYVLGEYAVTVPIETFMADERKRGGEPTPDIVRLLGARLALASEPAVSAKLSESMVKTVTGEEAMTARRLFQEQFEFFPTFKLTISVNIKPSVRGQDEGIWRRIALVPFETFIPVEERDRGLTDKLKQEAPGILNWMLDGFLEWLEHGLPATPRIAEAVEEYRTESDPIGEFMRQRTKRTPGWSVRAGELHKSYLTWFERNFGDRKSAASSTMFGRRLADLGYHKDKASIVVYRDLELLPDPDADDGNSAEDGGGA